MADELFDPGTKKFYSGQSGPTSVKGARAGERFDSTAEVQRKKKMDAFLKEKGWDGIAGAAKAPRGAELERQFRTWDDARTAKTEGQKKALASSE